MKILRAWILVSALIFAISFAVHFSTFLGIDPMTAIPGVMFLHLAIFPPFIAAIMYANKSSRHYGYDQKKLLTFAPSWMRVMAGIFFAYCIINFVLFIALSGGCTPERRDGKFLMMSHGKIVREISEAEFHRQQVYIVRGFSGHWMLFSCGAMTLLTGVARCREINRPI